MNIYIVLFKCNNYFSWYTKSRFGAGGIHQHRKKTDIMRELNEQENFFGVRTYDHFGVNHCLLQSKRYRISDSQPGNNGFSLTFGSTFRQHCTVRLSRSIGQ